MDWSPSVGSHLLVGANGAGKTSLLEAIYVLATTRSFRTSRIQDCISHDLDGLHLSGRIDGERRATLDVTVRTNTRARLINGKASTLGEHLGVLPTVAWTSQSEAEVLVGAPAARRRFLNRGIVGLRPSVIENLSRLRQILLHKRDCLSRNISGIEAWNELLATEGSVVAQERSLYVASLAEQLSFILKKSSLEFPEIRLLYRPSPPSALGGREDFLRALEGVANVERSRRQAVIGPQRDELEILWGGYEIRRVASAGQRKALSLALLAAHLAVMEHSSRSPLALLDDPDAELSPKSVAAMWSIFSSQKQVLVTSSRPKLWLPFQIGHLWEVEGGSLRHLS